MTTPNQKPGQCSAVERVEQRGQPNVVIACERMDTTPFDLTPYFPDGINGETIVPMCAFHREAITAEWDAGLRAKAAHDTASTS